ARGGGRYPPPRSLAATRVGRDQAGDLTSVSSGSSGLVRGGPRKRHTSSFRTCPRQAPTTILTTNRTRRRRSRAGEDDRAGARAGFAGGLIGGRTCVTDETPQTGATHGW